MCIIPEHIRNLTDKELLNLYYDLLQVYNILQNNLFNYSTYVKKNKSKEKIKSPKELLDKRTETWHELNPIMIELQKRGINFGEKKKQTSLNDWIQ